LVGTQDLYGKETISKVKKHAQIMVDEINKSGNLPFVIHFAGVAETADNITKVIKEVNYHDNVIGLIT
jgi:L-arabinose isomerase